MGVSHDLARGSSDRPGRTLAVWGAAATVCVVVVALLLGPALSQEIHLTGTTESQQATTVLAERLRPDADTELFLVSSATTSVDAPEFRAYVERLQSALQGLGPEVVTVVVTYYQTEDPSMVSPGPADDLHPDRRRGEGE